MASVEHRELLEEALRLRADGVVRQVPLSEGQRALWAHHVAHPDSHVYNIACLLRPARTVDPKRFRTAAQGLYLRHEALRTVFVPGPGGIPLQRVLEDGTPNVDIVDARGWSEARLVADQEQRATQPFDLAGATLRFVLYDGVESSVGTGQLLLGVCHHITGDGRTFAVLMNDMSDLYAAAERSYPDGSPGEPKLPRPAVPYAEFVGWQRDVLAGPAGDDLSAYWRGVFDGRFPTLDIPTDRPRSGVPGEEGDVVAAPLSAELQQRLRALASRCDVSLFSVLMAAFQLLLARLSGGDRVVVGTPTMGRTHSRFVDTVGYFANIVPIIGDLSTDVTFTDLLERTEVAVGGALAHQEMPFPRLVNDLEPPRVPGRIPVVEAVLVLQQLQAPHRGVTDNGRIFDVGTGLVPHRFLTDIAMFDLALEVFEEHGRLRWWLRYRRSLFDRRTAGAMLDRLDGLLRRIVEAPESRIRSLTVEPVLDSGAPRRRAIHAPAVSAPPPVGAAPDELETRLIRIWSEVLGIPTVGIDENFFELGGNSLALGEIRHRISEEFGNGTADLDLMELYEMPTVRGLAARMASRADAGRFDLPPAGTVRRADVRGRAARRIDRRPVPPGEASTDEGVAQ